MASKRNYLVKVSTINSVEDTKKAFPKDWFISGKWLNFQSLMEEGLIVKDFDENLEIGQIQAKGLSGEGRRPKWRRIKPPNGEG